MAPTEKIEHHVRVMLGSRKVTGQEADHLVRHLRGILSGVGDAIEQEIRKLVSR